MAVRLIGTDSANPALPAGVVTATFTPILTTKGDLLVATAAGAITRRSVGANGLALIADSAQAIGIKYGYPIPAVCQVKMASAQSIPDAQITTLLFDTEDLDALSWHSTASNTGRITPTIAGWYEVAWAADWQDDNDYIVLIIQVQKNGAVLTPDTAWDMPHSVGGGGNFRSHGTTPLIQMNGSTDYLSLIAYQDNTSNAANTCRALFKVQLEVPT